MSDTTPQPVSNDCRKYVKSRIKFNTFNTFNNVGIIFSSVIIVLLLVVFAAVTQAAVEYLVDCDDNNTKEEM